MDKIKLKARLLRYYYEWRWVALFIVLMMLFRSAIADWNHVPSGSMKPGILEGDRIVVDKISYDIRWPFSLIRIARWAHPQRGDIVTFPNPATPEEELFVKRVVAIPGDVVEMQNNRLIINGERATYTPLFEDQLSRLTDADTRHFRYFEEDILGNKRVIMLRRSRPHKYATFAPIHIPEGQYLMLGDNRDLSSDSRVIGLIERERVIGRAHTIAFSFNILEYYQPRFGRFFTDLL